jgi:hypothetical protein
MSPPVIQRVLNQLDRISIFTFFKSSEPHYYEPLSMASSNQTNLVSETSPAKADMEFSEDVEASRSSSKQGENTHIQHAELTDEDVCLSFQALVRCQAEILLLTF